MDILLDEDALPIPEAVRAASEMLGLDPLYIANEGLVLCDPAGKPCGTSVTLMRGFEEAGKRPLSVVSPSKAESKPGSR